MTDRTGIVFLLKYLYENTDMDHTVTSVQLRNMMKENGFSADPRTIRKDARILADSGFDIIVTEQNGVPTQYHYGAREWDMTELMILTDAVSSAQFITKAKSDRLIEKLAVLAGKQHRENLTPQVYVSAHTKAQNDKLLYIIEKISLGIRNKKKIAFKIRNYNTNKRQVQRHGGEVYVISPYNTVWKDDRYYVVGYSDKRNTVISVRIDRMTLPDLLEEDAVEKPADYNVQDYTDTVTKMYGGPEEEVTLRCRKDLVDNIIDKFGRGVSITNVTATTFDVTVKAAVSGTFLAWVFEYAGRMTVLAPESVRSMYADRLRTAMDDMGLGKTRSR
ncbi:MAG: WYL domain-containing protein [Clostridia bacterium]|nr:WYL domain-containing protein [Clostridia bacterium]